MNAEIDEVQSTLDLALVDLGNLVEKQTANTTNSSNTTEQMHAGSSNSSQVPSKKEAIKTETQPGKPALNKTSNAVAAVGTKAQRVRKVVQTQQTILEKLFKHLKSNIVNLNKEENSAKQISEKAVQKLQARLKSDKAELNKTGLSKFEHDRLVNRTRTDTFELQYWTRDRSLGHSMFHTNLKMQHGLMSRVHSVIAACKDVALKGHVDPEMMKMLRAQALPKAFIQMRSSLKHKAQQYYAHVLTARWMEAESATD